MNRLAVIALAALVTMASAVEEPQLLRAHLDKDAMEKISKSSMMAAEKDSADASSDKKKKAEGGVKVEKGVSCEGGFKEGKGRGKKCKGKVTSEFAMTFGGKDIASEVSGQMAEELSSFMMSNEEFYPDGDAMAEMMAFDTEAALDALEEGASKTFEFGGFVKAGFGCKVAFKKVKGKFEKTSVCEFGGEKGMGRGGSSVYVDGEDAEKVTPDL